MSQSRDQHRQGKQVIEWLRQKRGDPESALWSPLLNLAFDHYNKTEWDRARIFTEECMILADNLEAVTRDRSQAHRLKGAGLVLMGAIELAQRGGDDAIEYYQRAHKTFEWIGEQYGVAVSLFAIGLAYHSRQRFRECLKYYEWALRALLDESDKVSQALRREIDEQLQAAIQEFQSGLPATKPKSAPSATLELFPVFQDVSAGPGIWTDPLSLIQEHVEGEHVLIEGQRYQLFKLSELDSQVLRIDHSFRYGVSRVIGNSMNRRNIQNGDYVIYHQLLDVETKSPENAIVAYSIDHSQRAIVKRFQTRDDKIVLIPESDDEEWQNETPYDPEIVGLIGIVVGVLKPVKRKT